MSYKLNYSFIKYYLKTGAGLPRIFITILIVFSFSSVNATELKILSADFDPYTYETPKGGSGVMYEVVQELAKRVGQKTDISFVPWARAQTIAKQRSDIGIFPLARDPAREDHYVWLVHILDDPYVFFARKNTKFDISTVEAVKKLRIGTFRGSLAEVLLRKAGLNNYRSVLSDAQNVKMLKLGRIDLWVAPLSFKNRYKAKGGLDENELRVGATIGVLHEYFASSKTLDIVTKQKWQKAFQDMKNDGSYAAIMKKYGFQPLR